MAGTSNPESDFPLIDRTSILLRVNFSSLARIFSRHWFRDSAASLGFAQICEMELSVIRKNEDQKLCSVGLTGCITKADLQKSVNLLTSFTLFSTAYFNEQFKAITNTGFSVIPCFSLFAHSAHQTNFSFPANQLTALSGKL